MHLALPYRNKINDVRCAYFGMIGLKWEKRLLSPRYIYCVSTRFILSYMLL